MGNDLGRSEPLSPEQECSGAPDLPTLPPLRGGEGGREDRGTGGTRPTAHSQRPDVTDRAALLGSLLADPSKATGVPHEEATALLMQLGAVQTALLARLQATPMTTTSTEKRAEADRLLTVAQAAEVLNVPVGWLYRRSSKLSFARKLGGHLRFSERGVRAYAAKPRT